MISRPIAALGLLCVLLWLAGQSIEPATAAPEADLWERWTAHNPGSDRTIDHGAWDRFFKNYVSKSSDGVNRVDYAGVTSADRKSLAAYIADLEATPISKYTRPEQFAYWVNLYNAVTFKLVLDHYPVESIRDIDISPGLFASGPWDKQLIAVEDEALTLNDIEHRILRPIWQDPRVHYAVLRFDWLP